MNKYPIKQPFIFKGQPVQPTDKPLEMSVKEATPLIMQGVLGESKPANKGDK